MGAGIVVIVILLILVIAFVALIEFHIVNISTLLNLFKLAPAKAAPKPTTPPKFIVTNCNNYTLKTINGSNAGTCAWNGGKLGVWISAGDYDYINVSIVGANNKTYLSQDYFPFSCKTYYGYISAPKQGYLVYIKGSKELNQSKSCSNESAGITINSTVLENVTNVVHYSFYDGDLYSGLYLGWYLNGSAFNTKPVDIDELNSEGCYPRYKWENYSERFYISSYNCSPVETIGNITSSSFLADKPFLNFQIVSPKNSNDYLEIISNNNKTVYLVDHIATYKISPNSSFNGYTFYNATIPMSTLLGKIVRLKIVQGSNNKYNYMMVGDIRLSNKSDQTNGLSSNITIYR